MFKLKIMKTPEQDWGHEWEEMQPHEVCPKCGWHYNEIAFDYQYCWACGWDAELQAFCEPIEPAREDYESGDADILTGKWN